MKHLLTLILFVTLSLSNSTHAQSIINNTKIEVKYYMEALPTNIYPDSTAILGDKTWIKNFKEDDEVKLTWVYSLGNSTTLLHRLLLI